MTNSYVIVMTTFPNQESLDKVSALLLEAGLAACIQQVEINSTFSWQGKIESEREKLVLIKTKSTLFDEIKTIVLKAHPYDTPELIQIPIEKLAEGYQAWMEGVLKGCSDEWADGSE